MEWNIKDKIAQRVISYYAEQEYADKHILHTQAVANYTRLIAVENGADQYAADLQEIAAWFHDIGCPIAYKTYGNTLPEHQQKAGKQITTEWLSNETGLTETDKEWIAQVVGTHHQFHSAKALHFEPLFEADLIVNILEGHFERERAKSLYEKLVTTKAGRNLFAIIFAAELTP
ncbi:hypothetical protein LJC57_05025 [Parabacteroides sp. OttesenSCG-928-G07]|nr:hypothetical protein [Parabacteroides sp. OttesenSCG-928-G07]